jgi:hypothetical protein
MSKSKHLKPHTPGVTASQSKSVLKTLDFERRFIDVLNFVFSRPLRNPLRGPAVGSYARAINRRGQSEVCAENAREKLRLGHCPAVALRRLVVELG